MRLEQCQGAATCVCAVMIRSGLSTYVLDTCAARDFAGFVGGETQAPRAKLYNCHEGRNNMVISQTGAMYKVSSVTSYSTVFENVCFTTFIPNFSAHILLRIQVNFLHL